METLHKGAYRGDPGSVPWVTSGADTQRNRIRGESGGSVTRAAAFTSGKRKFDALMLFVSATKKL